MTLRLTIVTITKDDPVGLARTVHSAAGLRAAGVEHVVIEGSVDPKPSLGVLEDLRGMVRHELRRGRGIADAFNAGISLASGEWLWFLNGGDAVHEDLEPDLLLQLLARTRSDLLIGTIHHDGESVPRPPPALGTLWPVVDNWIPHPAALIRRRVFENASNFDTRLQIAMDFDLWQRVLTRDRSVDLVSLPFVRFDVGGLSQRIEWRGAVKRENARVLARYALPRVGDCWWLLRRFVRAFARTMYWLVRRPGKHGATHHDQ